MWRASLAARVSRGARSLRHPAKDKFLIVAHIGLFEMSYTALALRVCGLRSSWLILRALSSWAPVGIYAGWVFGPVGASWAPRA
eukprot:2570413-Pyramimonas_sp.AAC.1